MRRLVLITAAVLSVLAPVPGARAETADLPLFVDDGEFFYDSTPADGVCNPDTNNRAGAQAVRHWHVGLPFVPAAAEAARGFGCLGEPKTWTVTSEFSMVVEGRVRYTWDQNVPGGCCNDVHIHVTDDASGDIVRSTFFDGGVQPVNPVAPAVLEHAFDWTLPPGTYTITEDIFSGEHSAWLTQLNVVEVAAQL